MKILVELLGGTIGSHKDGNGTVVLGRDMTHILPEGVDAIVRSPLTYSSENATADTYREALRAISSDIDETDPEGILILHGTDTMAFFAQLAYRVLGGARPIQIAGSVLPPDDPASDYKKQITDAVKFLEEGKSGVVCEGR
ncbi:MAG: asparaginase, partial [Clostridiales bacterium]|nr:asparaginase [Clostridiales bacterium]